MAKEWQEVEESDKTQQETLLKLVKEIVPYNMAHNAEHEACDLLMEIERLDMLEDYIDENAYGKVCLYLTRYVQVLHFALTKPFFPPHVVYIFKIIGLVDISILTFCLPPAAV